MYSCSKSMILSLFIGAAIDEDDWAKCTSVISELKTPWSWDNSQSQIWQWPGVPAGGHSHGTMMDITMVILLPVCFCLNRKRLWTREAVITLKGSILTHQASAHPWSNFKKGLAFTVKPALLTCCPVRTAVEGVLSCTHSRVWSHRAVVRTCVCADVYNRIVILYGYARYIYMHHRIWMVNEIIEKDIRR